MQASALLLRAVNVGGTGKLPMLALRSMMAAAGALDPRTIGASGNAVFLADDPQKVSKGVGDALQRHFGKPVTLFLRSTSELDAALAQNPFKDGDPSRVAFVFLDGTIPQDPTAEARHQRNENMASGPGCLYIHYPDGMGRSKLAHPAIAQGSARNLNTVNKLLAALQALNGK